MRIYEQVYTSAADLLDPGGGHLGVIAQTKGFPKACEAEFAGHRSYFLVSNAAAPPARYVFGLSNRSNKHFLLSRVSFGGVDHTGRTTPFAHHVALEIEAHESPKATIAQLIRLVNPLFYHEWQGPPRWIDPPREADLKSISCESSLSGHWAEILSDKVEAIVASMADVLVGFSATQRPLLICLPVAYANTAPSLIADILDLMPPSRQLACSGVTHVVEAADYLRDSHVIVTYPETPFLNQCRARHDPRRPVLFDLAHQESIPTDQLTPYANLIRRRLQSGGLPLAMRTISDWDRWGLSGDARDSFCKVKVLAGSLKATSNIADFAKLVENHQNLLEPKPLRDVVTNWAVDNLRRVMTVDGQPNQWGSLAQIGTDTRWPMEVREVALSFIVNVPAELLSRVAAAVESTKADAMPVIGAEIAQHAPLANVLHLVCDDRWPTQVQSLAFQRITLNPEEALPALLPIAEGKPRAIERIKRALEGHTPRNLAIADLCLQIAVERPTEPYLDLARRVIASSSPPFSIAVDWFNDAEKIPDTHREVMKRAIRQKLERASGDEQDVQVLRNGFERQFGQDVQTAIADRLMTLAIASGDAEIIKSDLNLIVRDQLVQDKPTLLKRWLRTASNQAHKNIINQVLETIAPEKPHSSDDDDDSFHHRRSDRGVAGSASSSTAIEGVAARNIRQRYRAHRTSLLRSRWLLFCLAIATVLPPLFLYYLVRVQWRAIPLWLMLICPLSILIWAISRITDYALTRAGRPSAGVFRVRTAAIVLILAMLVAQFGGCFSVSLERTPDLANALRSFVARIRGTSDAPNPRQESTNRRRVRDLQE